MTVDWSYIAQTFTKGLDEVRNKEHREQGQPKSLRWARLESLGNENLTPKQLAALQELVADQVATFDAWVSKEKLRWIQKAPPRAARWRITNYLKVMRAAVSEKPLLKPMGKALSTLERHVDSVTRRWISELTNARLEGMGGLFQAAQSRARGYRNDANVIAMIYLIGSSVCRLLDHAKSKRNDEEPFVMGQNFKPRAAMLPCKQHCEWPEEQSFGWVSISVAVNLIGQGAEGRDGQDAIS
ncbi:transposase [Halomonas sp. V046]|uniref:transposase n=1 Tax=Halomonas sp. V046 TaxID=3459611 RepID=UPI0040444037